MAQTHRTWPIGKISAIDENDTQQLVSTKSGQNENFQIPAIRLAPIKSLKTPTTLTKMKKKKQQLLQSEQELNPVKTNSILQQTTEQQRQSLSEHFIFKKLISKCFERSRNPPSKTYDLGLIILSW